MKLTSFLWNNLCVCVCVLNCFSLVQLCNPIDHTARQASLSMEFSRQEYWSGLPCPSPGDFPDPGIESTSLTFPALAGGFFTTRATWEAPFYLSSFSFTSSFLKSKRMNELKTQIIYDLFMIKVFKGCTMNIGIL